MPHTHLSSAAHLIPTYDTGSRVLHFGGRRGTYKGTIPRINDEVANLDLLSGPTIGAAPFGQITSTQGPERQIQFGLKFIW